MDGSSDSTSGKSICFTVDLYSLSIDELISCLIAELGLTNTTVVAVTCDVLCRSIELVVVLVVFAIAIELQVATIYRVTDGLRYSSYLFRPVDVITTTASFAEGMDFPRQTRIIRRTEITTEAERT